jgi:hypothetical protein
MLPFLVQPELARTRSVKKGRTPMQLLMLTACLIIRLRSRESLQKNTKSAMAKVIVDKTFTTIYIYI